jgi:predicted dehydrogenase
MIRFAAVGLSHNHIYNQVDMLLREGGALVSFWGREPERVARFAERYPQAVLARGVDEILDDPAIQMVVGADTPAERAPFGVRAMRAGKDVSMAKPGFVSLDQLAEVRRAHADTGRRYIVHFGERVESAVTIRALDLVRAGAVGRVVHTSGFGPHRLLGHIPREPWTFDAAQYGGILNDLASHQIDQFLFFTGSESAEIVSAHAGNMRFAAQFPAFQDYGDITIRAASAAGYIRVDWLTPDGLDTWGDVRLFVLGTDGYLELRKNIDLAGRPGKDHLFLVNHEGTRYIDCADTPITYGARLVADTLNRTETAITQAHVFTACELALKAQAMAVSITP